jgi:hypothetical protein
MKIGKGENIWFQVIKRPKQQKLHGIFWLEDHTEITQDTKV